MPKFGDPGHPPSLGAKTQFTSDNRPNGGRYPSLRNQLKDLLDQDGRVIIPASQVVSVDKKTGDVTIKVPTREQLSHKLMGLALSGRSAVTMSAIKMLFEQLEGKAPQTVKIEHQNAPMTEEEILAEMERVDALIEGRED